MRDKFGRKESSGGFRSGELEPYIVEENTATGITYICYDNGDVRAIRRITESASGTSATTTIEVAFGAWTNRAALTYSPVNSDLNA